MVKDIFGNEHLDYQITSSRYDRIVIIKDLISNEISVVHKNDLKLPISEDLSENSPKASHFNLKKTQTLHYTRSDLLRRGASTIIKSRL